MSCGVDFRMYSASVVSFEEARRIVEEHAARAASAARSPAHCTRRLKPGQSRLAPGGARQSSGGADSGRPRLPSLSSCNPRRIRGAGGDVARVPARLEVIGEIKAGDSRVNADAAIQPGQAVSIMTGAPLPEGCGCGGDGRIHGCLREFSCDSAQRGKRGEFCSCGAEARAGQLLIDKGRRLDHALIGLAAAVGKSRVKVFHKPRIAVLATGDEIVEIGMAPAAAQIRNSNSYSLAAQIEEAGGEAVRLAIAPDEPKRLRELIEEGLACDLLLIAGGVSMGKYDLVEQVLAETGSRVLFHGRADAAGEAGVWLFGAGPRRVPTAHVQPIRRPRGRLQLSLRASPRTTAPCHTISLGCRGIRFLRW